MEQITIDLIPNGKMPMLHASQYDDGRQVRINLTENRQAYTLTGNEVLSLSVRKADNTLVTLDIANTFGGKSYVEFATTEQMCACAGMGYGELRIKEADKDIGTLNFTMWTEQSPEEGGVRSDSEINNLARQVNEMVDAEMGDYYNKTEADEKFATNTDLQTLSGVVDTKASQTDLTALAGEVDGKADKTYVDTELAKKADKSNTYTKTEVDTLIDNLPEPMIFKGTLGVGGTIQSLPDASASNEGYTYKVITDGTYAGQTAKVGDVFTSNGSAWVLIPSGDEDNDTWRAIKVEGVEVLGNGISSGAVDFVGSENIEVDFDGNGNKVEVKTKNIYTKAQVDDIVYNILPDDMASGSVANFTTSLELPLKSLEVDVNAVQNAGTPTPASPLPISGWSEITLVNCGNKYKPNIKPFSEWEIARSDYYISRFSVPKTIITVNLIDKDTTVDLTGIAFGFVDSYWNKANPITTNEYRWFIQNGTPQTTKKNIAIADASKILTGLIFSPQNEATYNKLMARYDYEFVFSETSDVEPYNTEVISLGGTCYGGKFTQDKDGNRKLTVDMEKDTMSSSYLSGLSSSYIGYVASVPAMNNHPCIWVRNWIIPPACKERKAGGIKAICNAFNISMNNTSIISTQYRVYFDVDGMGITDEAGFVSAIEAMEQNGNNLEICYEVENPVNVDLPDGEPIITINGTNNIYADTGDSTAVFKCSVNDYINAHQGGGSGAKSLGGVFLGGSNSGSEEEPTEEEPKEVTKTLGDEPISKK